MEVGIEIGYHPINNYLVIMGAVKYTAYLTMAGDFFVQIYPKFY